MNFNGTPVTKVWLLTAWGTDNIKDIDWNYFQFKVLWLSEIYADKSIAEQRKQELKQQEEFLWGELETAYHRTYDTDIDNYFHYIEDPVRKVMFELCMNGWWDVDHGIETIMFPLEVRIEQKDLLGK